jgi:hypothetical protein
MRFTISPAFKDRQKALESMINGFSTTGQDFVIGRRNTIKTFPLGESTVNVKSFRVPNLLNAVVYTFFRKSKARRSFEFAQKLEKNGIGTPEPIAYVENYGFPGLKESYYMCGHIMPDLTFRELVEIPDYPEHNIILRQFVAFSFKLHQAGIEFKDHSPGNTLIVRDGPGRYSFFLVDLNRMNFHESMSFEQRMENLKRLTPKKEMVEVMSNEYAKLYKQRTEAEIFELLWARTEEFQRKFWRKRALKQKLKLK